MSPWPDMQGKPLCRSLPIRLSAHVRDSRLQLSHYGVMPLLTLQLLSDEKLLGVRAGQIVPGSTGNSRKRKCSHEHNALPHNVCCSHHLHLTAANYKNSPDSGEISQSGLRRLMPTLVLDSPRPALRVLQCKSWHPTASATCCVQPAKAISRLNRC